MRLDSEDLPDKVQGMQFIKNLVALPLSTCTITQATSPELMQAHKEWALQHENKAGMQIQYFEHTLMHKAGAILQGYLGKPTVSAQCMPAS